MKKIKMFSIIIFLFAVLGCDPPRYSQNVIHRWFGPGRQHYYTGYKDFIGGWYGFSGYFNPFSLY